MSLIASAKTLPLDRQRDRLLKTDALCVSTKCVAVGQQRKGGTISSFREYSAWPVTCLDCRAISSANTCKLPLVCGECGTSNVVELQDSRTYAGDGEWTSLAGVGPRTDGRALHMPALRTV
jgi:hypothetical protein